MRLFVLFCYLLGAVIASSVQVRDPRVALARKDDKGPWQPKTKDPHFFNLQVDDLCSYPGNGPPPCKLANYAIRLEKGTVIATPYNKWYDGPLPMFFVDEDTQMYTVSKEPLQMYVDEVSGALMYSKAGWVPPSAIAIGFYHTGTNPLGVLHPSSSYLTWPSTFGTSVSGTWTLCPIGGTGQYKVYVDFNNFTPQGVTIDTIYCESEMLAATNANPWSKSTTTKKPSGGS